MITKSERNKLLYFKTNPSDATLWTNIIVNESDRMILIGDTTLEADLVINGEVICI